MNETHPVLFVGAGPGAPELITVAGRRALESADVVVYAGSLVPEAVLVWTRDEATCISSASMDLAQIVTEMETAYRAGKKVVRLHTGDPSLYGATFEQMGELDRRGIEYRVIPGVTAAFAAAAAMGVEYTLPQISQTLILTRMEGKTPVPEAESLEALARHRASMAIYLSVSLVDKVAAALSAHYGEDAPCAVAYKVSQPEEKILRTTVGGLVEAVQAAAVDRQALIIVGEVLRVSAQKMTHKSRLYDSGFSHLYRKGDGGR